MKNFLVVFALLISLPCFATTEDDEDLSKPMHYALVPNVGYHFGFSELSGKSGVTSGPAGGLGFRFMRDGYFFTPNARLVTLIGLNKSPAAMWTVGFIAGLRLKVPNCDVFIGLDSATIIDYHVTALAYHLNAAAMFKVGVIFDLGLSDFQVVLNGFYGQFESDTQLTSTKVQQDYFDYSGVEVALQFPIDL